MTVIQLYSIQNIQNIDSIYFYHVLKWIYILDRMEMP